jgi:hypothetical protein
LGFHSDSFALTEAEGERLVDKEGHVDTWPIDLQAKYHNWYQLPVLCSMCGTIGVREELPDSYGFNMQPAKIAERMAQFFTALGGVADIYMVRTKKDLAFQKAREELYSADHNFSRYRKTLESARDRDCVYYPLRSIIKDTAGGGDLVSRFKALLEA